MADAADPPPTPPPAPPTLFDCVIRDDFDGMVRLYATAARDSAVSYAAFRRWKNRHQSSCELCKILGFRLTFTLVKCMGQVLDTSLKKLKAF